MTRIQKNFKERSVGFVKPLIDISQCNGRKLLEPKTRTPKKWHIKLVLKISISSFFISFMCFLIALFFKIFPCLLSRYILSNSIEYKILCDYIYSSQSADSRQEGKVNVLTWCIWMFIKIIMAFNGVASLRNSKGSRLKQFPVFKLSSCKESHKDQ